MYLFSFVFPRNPITMFCGTYEKVCHPSYGSDCFKWLGSRTKCAACHIYKWSRYRSLHNDDWSRFATQLECHLWRKIALGHMTHTHTRLQGGTRLNETRCWDRIDDQEEGSRRSVALHKIGTSPAGEIPHQST